MKLPMVIWIWDRGKPKDGQPGEPALKNVEFVLYPVSPLPQNFTLIFPVQHTQDGTYSYLKVDFTKTPQMPNLSDLSLLTKVFQTFYNTFTVGKIGIRAAEGKLVNQGLMYGAGSHAIFFLLGVIFGKRICAKK